MEQVEYKDVIKSEYLGSVHNNEDVGGEVLDPVLDLVGQTSYAEEDNKVLKCEDVTQGQDDPDTGGETVTFDDVQQTHCAVEENVVIKCEPSDPAQNNPDSGGVVPVFHDVDQTLNDKEGTRVMKCKHSGPAQDNEDSGGEDCMFDHFDQTSCAKEDNEHKPNTGQVSMNSDDEQIDSAFEKIYIPDKLNDEIVDGSNIKYENTEDLNDKSGDFEDGVDLPIQSNSTFDVCDDNSAWLEGTNLSVTLVKNLPSISEEGEYDIEYICSVCPEVFFSSKKLKRHMNKEHIKKSKSSVFSCEFCGKAFMSSSHLSRHILMHSHRTKSFKCDACSNSYYSAQALRKHLKCHDSNHKVDGNQCGICGKHYKSQTYFTVHMLEHRGEKAFSCGVCGKKFSIARQVERHMLNHMEKKYKCRICIKRFKTSVDRRRHEAIHCGESTSQCHVCNRFVRNIKIHMRVHSGTASFKCEVCGKGLHTKRGLREHYALHTDRQLWTCDVCGSTLTTKSSLRTHGLRVHSTEKIFFCKEPGCNKGFCLEYLLNDHMRSHTQKLKSKAKCVKLKKTYSCNECHKVYLTKPSLDDHMNIHRSGRSFSCSECYKMCFTQTQLNKHMASHNLKKIIVNRSSTNQEELQIDEEPKPGPSTQTGQRIKYKNIRKHSFCPICEKSYRANQLSVHVRTRHPGQKPFKCNLCDEAFVVDTYLKLHIDKKH